MSIRNRLPRLRRPSVERLSLQELREQLGVRRADVARRLGRSPQAVLQFEQGLDPKIGTLGDYVRALADELDSISGEVSVTATFDDEAFELDLGASTDSLPVPHPESEIEVNDLHREAAPGRDLAPTTKARATVDAWKIGSATWFSPDQVDRMLAEGFIAISEDEIDVSDDPDDRTIAQRLRAAPREVERQSGDRAIQTYVRYWRTFLTAIRPGDVVVLPRNRSNVAVGVVLGEPMYIAEESDPKLRHRRAVDWFRPDLAKKDMPDDLARSAAARGTIGMIRAEDAANRLLGLKP